MLSSTGVQCNMAAIDLPRPNLPRLSPACREASVCGSRTTEAVKTHEDFAKSVHVKQRKKHSSLVSQGVSGCKTDLLATWAARRRRRSACRRGSGWLPSARSLWAPGACTCRRRGSPAKRGKSPGSTGSLCTCSVRPCGWRSHRHSGSRSPQSCPWLHSSRGSGQCCPVKDLIIFAVRIQGQQLASRDRPMAGLLT